MELSTIEDMELIAEGLTIELKRRGGTNPLGL
jgi:hypothetical protein